VLWKQFLPELIMTAFNFLAFDDGASRQSSNLILSRAVLISGRLSVAKAGQVFSAHSIKNTTHRLELKLQSEILCCFSTL
jgi:hypothetical protein